MAEERQQIKFIYRRVSDFQRIPVSGVIGAVNPQGMVVAQYYFESATLPEEETQTITEGGTLEPSSRPGDSPSFDREIQTAAVMAPHVAKAIGKWLIEKAEQAEQARGPIPS